MFCHISSRFSPSIFIRYYNAMQCEPIKLLFSKNIFKENKIINFFTKVQFVGLHK